MSAAVRVRSLLGEINDEVPPASKLTLLPEACPVNESADAACAAAENPSSETAWDDAGKTLLKADNLGCRNPIGLDHILIGSGWSAVGSAEKIPLGRLGRTLPASETHPDPLLAISDHCPLVAIIHN